MSLWRSGLRAASRALEALSQEEPPPTTPVVVQKAQLGETSNDEVPPPAKSLMFDPFAVVEQVGYKDRPTQVSYDTLKTIVWKSPVISAVIQARVNQGAAFATLAQDRFGIGHMFKHRDGNRALTKAEKSAADEMSRTLAHTAATDDGIGRDNFETFLRRIFWDSLVYDQYCFEVVPNRKGKPCAFYAVDAASIRLADSLALQFNPQDMQATRYVQVFDGMVVEEYSRKEMCFGVRNPRTEMRLNGYGTSELEMMMIAVTGLVNGMDYNSRFFSQATTAKGLLNIKGAINPDQLNLFKKNWYAMLRGIENAWQTPVLNHSDELQWINMQTNNRDMEFSAWMDFLIKLCCAFYMLDPSEVNFHYGNVGQTQVLQDRSNNDKVTESRERGLKPILRHLANSLNQYLVWPIYPDLSLEFVGLDVMSRSELADLNQKRVSTYYTVDEIRAEEGLTPMPNGQGAIILNQIFLQNMQSMAQGSAAGAQGGDMGEPPPGDEGGDMTPEQAQETAQDNAEDAAADDDAQQQDAQRAAKSLLVTPSQRLITLDVTL